MSKTVIKVEGLSKQYRLGQVGTGTLSHDLNRWWHRIRGKEDPYLKIGETNDRTSQGTAEYVWALRDINFDVQPGEVLGIIGKNGAGKSTLLKLLSKVTGPSTGTIKAKGRIASLLEVGTGFHPELTGRENVYLNGTILGMTRKEISEKLEEIVDFSGVARYIDTPVKRYSSGMMVRLGFAVAAHLEPEILIVDEVLAVGDAEFQRKAIGKMQDVSQKSHRTVLFVSHNMASVKALCTRCIVLKDGMLDFSGPTLDAIVHYQNNSLKVNETDISWNINSAPGNDKIKVLAIKANPIKGNLISIETGVKISIDFFNFLPDINLDLTTELVTKEEVIVFHHGLILHSQKNAKKGHYSVSLEIPPMLLNANIYKLNLIFGDSQRFVLFKVNDVFAFEIHNSNAGQGSNMKRTPGIIRPSFDWHYEFVGDSQQILSER